jgi:hypothetical protein
VLDMQVGPRPPRLAWRSIHSREPTPVKPSYPGDHVEEHRRAPEPDAGPDQRRGAVRRAQAELRPRVQEAGRAGPHPRLPPRQGARPRDRVAHRPCADPRRGRQRGDPGEVHGGDHAG